MKTMDSAALVNLTGMLRDDVVPYYTDLLIAEKSDQECARVNALIINRWSTSALIYIKEKAWKFYQDYVNEITEQ
ncbi:MAG: hypothetical protein EOO39_00250 [Cytophagaceae bacterium]|nr:MAG: hypothetical protein EOO39_00250 [Cytophagaceae bacterium]